MVERAGLSVAAIKVSELMGPKRIDAECYRAEFLDLTFGPNFYPLKDLCLIRSGTTPSDRDNELKEGIILLKTTDIRNSVLPKSGSESYYRINTEIADRMRETSLQARDVLINIVGATTDVIGRVAYVPSDFPEANITQAMAFLRVTDQRLKPAFLFSFLAGKYGNVQVRRYARPTGQFNLNLHELSIFKVPLLPRSFQDHIENLVETAQRRQEDSKRLYIEAQTLLAAELGLDRLDLSESLYSVRRASEVVAAGRVDAEYYKPKYQRLLEHLRSTGQAVRLGDWVREPIRRGVQPEYSEDGEITVINSQHVGKTQVDLDDNRKTSRQFCGTGTNKRAVVHKHDVLLNSTGYITIGRCQVLLDDVNAIVDGHVSIIRPKQGLDPVFLAMYLNALAGQMQTERGWTGSSGQIELRIDVITEFLIWKAPPTIQLQVRQLVEQSYQARRDAKRLLTEAKAEVERMIEEGAEALVG